MEERPKRKTHTSTEVKRRYNQKTYDQFNFSLRKDDPVNKALKGYDGSKTALIRELLRKFFGIGQE
ncbi:MAG: hypothetical protein LBD02_01260 [Christensenellaceae bacterium]|jgi:hypothetical protein|nr:hypothetical protein [Christensenellaceae bacterium]